MLIDINLLPSKGEKKRIGSFLFIIIPVAIILIGGSLFSYLYLTTNNSLAAAKQELSQTQAKVQAQQQQLKQLESSSSANQLKQMIEWGKANQVSTVKVLDTFTALLPQDGYFVNYQFNSGTINISVQFDSMDGAADYLFQLQNSSIVQSAELTNVSTKPVDKVDQNSQDTNQDEKILPRYLGQYQIKLNMQKVKKAQEETAK
jgi:type IV pilus assembly protein PilN